jgi:hypothetical protein
MERRRRPGRRTGRHNLVALLLVLVTGDGLPVL